MEAALTVFSYELLDKYVADLIANGKFDGKTLDYVDIGRSNDLLKNLTLSNNKQAILENAFAACPYNIAVYMQAMKYDLLDYDSFQTAKVFKQEHHVLSFFRESWGEVSFPTKFNIKLTEKETIKLRIGNLRLKHTFLHRLQQSLSIVISLHFRKNLQSMIQVASITLWLQVCVRIIARLHIVIAETKQSNKTS